MAFLTIKDRVSKSSISTHADFAYAMRLVFSNCRAYNKPNEKTQPILDMAKQLSEKFEQDYRKFREARAAKEKRVAEDEAKRLRMEEVREKGEGVGRREGE